MARRTQNIRCRCHKTDGSPCPNWAMHDQEVCHAHGGRTPQAKSAARGRLLDEQARQLFGEFVPVATPVTNPLRAYAVFAGKVLAWMDLMDSLLAKASSVGYSSERSGEQIRAEVQTYERAMQLVNQVLSGYGRLKIDDRLAAIAQSQKDTLIRALEVGLEAAGVEDEQLLAAKRAAAAYLRSGSA